jgi:Uma2 family endonuclease
MFRYEPPRPESVLTVEEYARLEHDDGYVDELDRGWLVREPRPGTRHGWIALRLGGRLQLHVERERLGLVCTESGFVFHTEPRTLRGPDVSFVRMERLCEGEPTEGFLHLAPDLVAEVVSPSSSADQLHQKVVQYLEAGVRLVWVVHPRSRTVTEYRSADIIRLLHEDEDLSADDIVPRSRDPGRRATKRRADRTVLGLRNG